MEADMAYTIKTEPDGRCFNAETDETILKMDEIWEEEAVTFMANKNSCGAQPLEQPIKFTPPKRAETHSN